MLVGCTGWGYAGTWVLRHTFTDLQGICWSLPTPHPAFGGDQSLQFLCLSGVPRCRSAALCGLLLCRQVDFSFLCAISSVVDFQNCFMSSPLSFSLPFWLFFHLVNTLAIISVVSGRSGRNHTCSVYHVLLKVFFFFLFFPFFFPFFPSYHVLLKDLFFFPFLIPVPYPSNLVQQISTHHW